MQPNGQGVADAAVHGGRRLDVSHVQEWVETERACYLLRQHVYASLSHRLGTRPFLSHLEKVNAPVCAHTVAVPLSLSFAQKAAQPAAAVDRALPACGAASGRCRGLVLQYNTVLDTSC